MNKLVLLLLIPLVLCSFSSHGQSSKNNQAKAEINVFFGFEAKPALAREVSSYLLKIDDGIEEQKIKKQAQKKKLAQEKARRDQIAKETLEKNKIEQARLEATHQYEEKLRREGKPVPIKRAPPKYPVLAARKGIDGWVIVSYTVSKTGTIKNCKVIDEYPEVYFHDEGCRAVNQWIYEPATLNGSPVEYFVDGLRLDFKLEE